MNPPTERMLRSALFTNFAFAGSATGCPFGVIWMVSAVVSITAGPTRSPALAITEEGGACVGNALSGAGPSGAASASIPASPESLVVESAPPLESFATDVSSLAASSPTTGTAPGSPTHPNTTTQKSEDSRKARLGIMTYTLAGSRAPSSQIVSHQDPAYGIRLTFGGYIRAASSSTCANALKLRRFVTLFE